MCICVRLNQRLRVSVSTWGRAAACFTDSACKKVFFGGGWGDLAHRVREGIPSDLQRDRRRSLSLSLSLSPVTPSCCKPWIRAVINLQSERAATEGGLREVCGNGTAHIFPGN